MDNITLSDFISNTLVEIAKGVKQANTELHDPDNNVYHVYELRWVTTRKTWVLNLTLHYLPLVSKKTRQGLL